MDQMMERTAKENVKETRQSFGKKIRGVIKIISAVVGILTNLFMILATEEIMNRLFYQYGYEKGWGIEVNIINNWVVIYYYQIAAIITLTMLILYGIMCFFDRFKFEKR